MMFGTVLHQGESFAHQMPGGGGWGDPLEREPKAVAQDVRNEKVSAEAAREKYGVILRTDGSVDLAKTEELRCGKRG